MDEPEGAPIKSAGSAAPTSETVTGTIPTRTCVIVLGMHRSGTSVLTGTLGLLGAALPTDLLGPSPSNPKGHFESLRFYEIHERMLAALHTAWYDFRSISPDALNSEIAHQFKAELIQALDSSYERSSLLVLKDPRICRFFPLVESVVKALGGSPRVILSVRNPLEVARSLKTRDGISLSHGLSLWLRHVLDAEFYSRALPRAVVDYSDFIRDWRTTIGLIEQRLGIGLSGRSTADESAVDQFVDLELRHERSSIDELEQRFGDRGWVKPCYQALLQLVRDPEDSAAMEQLDWIRAAFEEPASFFGGAAVNYYAEILRLEEAAPADTVGGSRDPSHRL